MWRIDRRFIWFFDWTSALLTVLLALCGLLFVWSATYTSAAPFSLFFYKQFMGIGFGVALYALFCMMHPAVLMRWGYWLYWCMLALLVVTLVKGSVGMGAQRWINLGFVKFQPSEITKLLFPPFFAYSVAMRRVPFRTVTDFLPILSVLLFSVLLVVKQPDLGTGLLILGSGLLLLWIARLPTSFFLWSFGCILLGAPLLWRGLKPYQKNRIAVFLGGGDARRERYQIEQSCIAIGSGGLWGKGLLRGTQNKLHFLPESRTDFIFSVICEETGFAGALLVLLLFALLMIRISAMIATLVQPMYQLLAIGLLLPLVLSVLVNVGMVLGLLPIVGIPLPLVSYGVTHSLMTWASLGWLNGIAARRFYGV